MSQLETLVQRLNDATLDIGAWKRTASRWRKRARVLEQLKGENVERIEELEDELADEKESNGAARHRVGEESLIDGIYLGSPRTPGLIAGIDLGLDREWTSFIRMVRPSIEALGKLAFETHRSMLRALLLDSADVEVECMFRAPSTIQYDVKVRQSARAKFPSFGDNSLVRRPGFHLSSTDPEKVFEVAHLRDYARLRAARLSLREQQVIYVWEWSRETGLRKVISSAVDGRVRWHRPCRACDERGCKTCDDFGSVVDELAMIECVGDSI